MDKRYTEALEEVKAKFKTIIEEQLVPLAIRLEELQRDKVLEGELMYSNGDQVEELGEYKRKIDLLEDSVSESIAWMGGSLEMVQEE